MKKAVDSMKGIRARTPAKSKHRGKMKIPLNPPLEKGEAKIPPPFFLQKGEAEILPFTKRGN
jgi:hypothetical protein